MKKIILKFTFAAIVAISLSSCSAGHSGYMSDSSALGAANFSYVKNNIKGESTATYILGIGGLAKSTLVDDAKQKMLSENPIKDNQTLTNLTVNFKNSYYLGVYWTSKCIVTADVVEFKK